MNTDLFDAAGAGICVLDADDRVAYANASLTRLIGRSSPELERTTVLQLVHEDAHDAASALLHGARGGTPGQADLPLIASDGSLLWAIASASLLPAGAGGPARVACILVDVTDRKRGEAVRRFARLALERHGYHVIDAATPEDALSLAVTGAHRPRLLLTDVVMPRMNGPELADRLTRMLPDLIVLYMSGYPSSILQDTGRDPSRRLIAKPFTVAELVAGIEDVLAAPGGLR